VTTKTKTKTYDKDIHYTLPADANVWELIEQAKEKFYKDPNVIGVGVGPKRRDQEDASHDEIALIVYVKEKLPLEDVRPEYVIAREFEGMGTDVFAPLSPDAPVDALGVIGAHDHSTDMSFIDWPRLHAQWQAEAGGEIAWHGKVQDRGDICMIEDDGTLIQRIGGQQTVDWVRAYKLFRTTHPDIYDFVTFITDTDNGMPPQGGSSWYRFVFNDIKGIGFGDFNQRPAYASNTLQGIMFLNQGHFGAWRYVMLQEQGHRWGSFARYRDTSAGPIQNDHLLGGWGHWTLNFDDDKSPMDYDIYDWVSDNGEFLRMSLGSSERTYCNLDLYLMGLLDRKEVGDFYLLSNPTVVSGNRYSATSKILNVQNIEWAEGARAPDAANSPKMIKTAFVVLTGDMDKVHDLVDRVDDLRRQFERDYHDATKMLGRVDTTLGPARTQTETQFRTVSVAIPNGTGKRSFNRTVTFDGPVRRAGVALNGFNLDYTNSDHHINVIEADTDVLSVNGYSVTIRVECQYADQNFDDPYSGYVTALVIADVG
jgi:hypothetical protein